MRDIGRAVRLMACKSRTNSALAAALLIVPSWTLLIPAACVLLKSGDDLRRRVLPIFSSASSLGIASSPCARSWTKAATLGEVGEIVVSVGNQEIVSHTPIEEMKARAPAPSTNNTVGRSKPRCHKQETSYSCVPA